MRKATPTIERWMTTSPRTIDHDAKLSEAHQMMREDQIRHLPVTEDGKLVGVVSQRDLHLIETLKDVDPEEVAVHEAMSSPPYFISPQAVLADVVAEMAEHKIGAAVVLEGRAVIGVFTTTDAMRAFAATLRSTERVANASVAHRAADPTTVRRETRRDEPSSAKAPSGTRGARSSERH